MNEVERLEFREIGEGKYWPPVVPNGKFFARPVGGDREQHILTVTDEGLRCGGVSFDWHEITGVAINGNEAKILSGKYPSGGLRFYLDTCVLLTETGDFVKTVSGYSVEYCLMNRVSFEAQKSKR